MRQMQTPYWVLEGYASSKDIEGISIESSIEFLENILYSLGPGNYKMIATSNPSNNARKNTWTFVHKPDEISTQAVGGITSETMTMIASLQAQISKMEQDRITERADRERKEWKDQIAELQRQNKELAKAQTSIDGQLGMVTGHLISGVMKHFGIPTGQQVPLTAAPAAQIIAGESQTGEAPEATPGVYTNEQEAQQQRVISALTTLADARGENYIAELESLANLAKVNPESYNIGLTFLK